VRLLLDEHLSPLVARRLRGLGHDAVSVAEQRELRGRNDERIRQAARAEDRVLVTRDVRDFSVLATRAAAAAESHPGMVLVSSRAFPGNADGIGRLVDAIHALAGVTPDGGFRDRVTWLADAPGG